VHFNKIYARYLLDNISVDGGKMPKINGVIDNIKKNIREQYKEVYKQLSEKECGEKN
jgi:hypothetical protein